MTLTLEDLKNVRFPIAKRTNEGYRALEVDAFLDQVDEAFTALTDENSRLKAQVEALGNGSATGAGSDELRQENESLKAELARLRSSQGGTASSATSSADAAELQRLRSENAELRAQAQQGTEAGPVRMVVTTSAEASPAVTRLVQLATEQAEAVVGEAQVEASRRVDEATARAQQITYDAQTLADRLQREAQGNADRVNQDAETRRREMFGDLEKERQQLTTHVEQLRSYEQDYRNNLIRHYQQSIDALSGSSFEPAGLPQYAGGSSRTPRLDALLAEGN